METILKENIPSTDPRLKRNIYHDPRSKLFRFDATGLTIKSVKHVRHIPILDQGQLGSCTGNAGIGAIATDPLFPALPKISPYSLDEAGAVKLYSDATKIDEYNGTYPPTDTGSSGLAIAKALKNAGLISGYQHAFTLEEALKAMQLYPVITGVKWYQGMFTPDADGRVRISGALAGGHEIEADEVDAELGRVWFCNSWSEKYGVIGRFYLTWEDYANLLKDRGDVTVLLPLSVPAPVPVAMPTLTILRNPSDKKETLGLATAVSGSNTFMCDSLELPDLNNQPNISCIPKGTYDAKWSYFPHLKRFAYQLQNVPGRSGIFIHVGNFFSDLKGCIALGASLADINGDGELDVTKSTITINAFNTLMAQKPIKVIIK